MFSDDVYVELMNEKIKIDEHYVSGMKVENTGSGIVLTINGREFKLGSTKGNSDFGRFSYSYYGVEAVIVSLPVAMTKELKINGKVGDDIPMEGKFKKFVDSHWSDISKLCKLEKIK